MYKRQGPLCIIMGAEDTGVSYENLALCDEWVKIPMLGTIESLNVSVAVSYTHLDVYKRQHNIFANWIKATCLME